MVSRQLGGRAHHNALTENPPTFARVINDAKVRAVRTVAERALRDDIGLLRHLNVAHLDELSVQKLDALTKTIVSNFRERQKEKDPRREKGRFRQRLK
jgi:hypothetical protein